MRSGSLFYLLVGLVALDGMLLTEFPARALEMSQAGSGAAGMASDGTRRNAADWHWRLTGTVVGPGLRAPCRHPPVWSPFVFSRRRSSDLLQKMFPRRKERTIAWSMFQIWRWVYEMTPGDMIMFRGHQKVKKINR